MEQWEAEGWRHIGKVCHNCNHYDDNGDYDDNDDNVDNDDNDNHYNHDKNLFDHNEGIGGSECPTADGFVSNGNYNSEGKSNDNDNGNNNDSSSSSNNNGKNISSGQPEPCQLLLQVSNTQQHQHHQSSQADSHWSLPQAPLNSRLVLEFTKLDLSSCESSLSASSSNTSSSENPENSCSFLVLDLDPPNTLGRQTFSQRLVTLPKGQRCALCQEHPPHLIFWHFPTIANFEQLHTSWQCIIQQLGEFVSRLTNQQLPHLEIYVFLWKNITNVFICVNIFMNVNL